MAQFIDIDPRQLKMGDEVYLLDVSKLTITKVVTVAIEFNRNGNPRRGVFHEPNKITGIIHYRTGASQRLFGNYSDAESHLRKLAKTRLEYHQKEIVRLNKILESEI